MASSYFSCILGTLTDSESTRAPAVQRSRLQTWLGILPEEKANVYRQVFAAAAINSVSYWLEIFFSAGIATFGLVENSPAVIIGAMLISPLMGPIMGTGLALAAGDLYLGIKAVLNLIVSVAVSILFSGVLVWLLPFHSATSEIIARTKPNLLDLGIALLSGLAGSVLVSRGGGKDVTALPGVAIAVALMPPLCTVGFGLGASHNFEIMGGAGLLFVTNLFAIVASAFLVFLLVGLNTEEVREVMATSRKDEWLAGVLSHSPITRVIATGGQLHWRIVMILILLGSVAVPLSRALFQVANETLTRGAVEYDLKRLAPTNAIVSQQVSVGKDEIVIRLISTSRIPDEKVTEVRDDLMRRTGRDVRISVDAVASKRELSELVERLAQPAVQRPVIVAKDKTIVEMQKDVLDKANAAIHDIWPSSDAPVQDFDVVMAASGIAVDIRYQATKDLGDVALNMVQDSLRKKLEMPDLILKTERTRPSKAKPRKH